MNTYSHQTAETPLGDVCAKPEFALGELLPDYVVGLLEDSVEEEIEDHLLDCLHCRNNYLKMLSVTGAAREAKAADSVEPASTSPDEGAMTGAKVIKLAEFRKRRS